MSVRPIVISGDPVLHAPAEPVTSFDADLLSLVEDMFDTMEAAPGVGLAAPQIGLNKQVFVYDYPEDDGTERRGVVINPALFMSPLEIRELSEADEEGCLSFPGERYALIRSEHVILRGQDLTGKLFEMECSGWFARIMQHEFDHLLGYLYKDRLEYPLQKMASKIERKRGWGVPGKSWMPGVDNLEG